MKFGATPFRRTAGLAVLIAATTGCDRPGAPPSPKSAEAASVATNSAKPAPKPRAVSASKPSRASCVLPLKEPPPPEAGPAQKCPDDPTGPLSLDTIDVEFLEAPGQPRVIAEHALTHAARQRGLMYRTEMPEDVGMLFSWDDQSQRSFWMKNTCLPLDMMFIDADGVIVSVLEQVPTLNTQPRRSGCPARHVLEVNAGWTRRHGVRPGQRVKIGG